MAAGAYGNIVAADTAKAKIFPAKITKIEIRASGENVSQFQDLGVIADGEIMAEPMAQPSASGPKQLAWKIAWKATILASGTAMRTALALVTSNFTDARITDMNGIVHTLLYTSDLHDMTVAGVKSGDADKAEAYTLSGEGTLTATRFVAIYTGV